MKTIKIYYIDTRSKLAVNLIRILIVIIVGNYKI